MAISKIIYKSSAEAEGEVWMDVTAKTVTSGTMLSGTTALKNDGTDITGNIATKTSANLSASGATVTAPAGYYATDASKSVASGTAGTPTATKGTVSSNSVTVTPSVTNTAGYISGGTLTGTAVTVSASELVSGTKNITASGTTDVTNYESASVSAGSAATPATSITANPSISVSSGGLITASVSTSQSVTPTVSAGYVSSGTSGTVSVSGSNTEQLTTQAAQTIHPSTTDQTIASGKYLTGTQTVKGVLLTNLDAGNIKKDVVVRVGDSTDDDCVASVTGTFEGGGGGLEYETGTYTPVNPVYGSATINFSNTHSVPPALVALNDASAIETSGTDQLTTFRYCDYYRLFGDGYPISTTSTGWATVAYTYRTSSGTSQGAVRCIYNSDVLTNTDATYSRFWVDEDKFYPGANSTSRYFMSGRTYEWIAVWAPTT